MKLALGLMAAFTTALLAGCQGMPTIEGFLAPGDRDKRPHECRRGDDCYVPADPRRRQWIAEYIRVDARRDERFRIWLDDVSAEFADPPLTWATAEGEAAFDCADRAAKIVQCKARDRVGSNVQYKFTLNVKGRAPYDPFVWTR